MRRIDDETNDKCDGLISTKVCAAGKKRPALRPAWSF